MRRNEKNIRDDFTDALNEEILSRKIFDKAKPPPSEEEKIFTAEAKAEIISEPKTSAITSDGKIYPNFQPAKKKKSERKKTVEKKVSAEKKSSPKKISQPPEIKISKKIKAENEFEKRIFAEAENDFYEEKPSELGENFRSKIAEDFSEGKIFHSKNLKSDVIEDKKESEETPDPELYRKLTRAETSGAALSTLMLVYAFANMDKPLFFVSLSLLVHLIRPLVGAFFGRHNRAVQNGMRSFSIVLFIGAITLIFM